MIRAPVLARYLIGVIRDNFGVENAVCAKRINILILVLLLIGSLLLVYFGMSGYIPEVFFGIGAGMAAIFTPALLYICCMSNDRLLLRKLVKRTRRACRVLTSRTRQLVRAPFLVPQDNPIPVIDDLIIRPSVALERRDETMIQVEQEDESPLDETVVESNPQAEVETSITWLTQDGIEESSEKAKHGQNLVTGSLRARNVQRTLDGYETPPIPGAISGPLVYDKVRRTKHDRGDEMVKPVQSSNSQVLQQPPEQEQYLPMERF